MRREKKPYVVMTFHTTEEAIAMETYGQKQGVKGRLIPVPGEISAGCGLCWRMEPETFGLFEERLKQVPHETIVEIRM
ncbi:MAG: DUF3343 domain-containing protein [Eubacteriales bacterium]|nr:DUF3343 domain-containing protein [Eubacteriales bacterium]